MSANVATNFPPHTYSSQFFLNSLPDEVGATSSKKRPKDEADSSNAVLDCFISTMQFCIIFVLIFLQCTICTNAEKSYMCVDATHTNVRYFDDILELQRNQLPFTPENNYVAFNAVTISHLQSNDFVTHQSNLIRKLILNDKRVELVDNGTFNELYCLRFLYLEDNLITEINNGTFEGLYSIQELNLKGNVIKEIPNGTFFKLKHLLRLDLSHNQIKILHRDSFQYLKSLYELNLQFNQIFALPHNFFSSTSRLHTLNLGNNKIILPDKLEYAGLNNLDLLDLENNLIQNICNSSILSLPISELNLFGNQLKSLNISELPLLTLERINIAHNNFQCTYLKSLLNSLEKHHVNVVYNHEILPEPSPKKIGCINGSTPISPSSTTTPNPPYFTPTPRVTTTTPTTEKTTEKTPNIDFLQDHLWKIEEDNRKLTKAVIDLKTVLIIVIIIIVMFHVIDILIRTNTCERFRRRFRRQDSSNYYQSRFQNSSYPLLQR